MSPHRLTSMRRYKISNDVLILILEKLDPAALCAICKAFRRIYAIVLEYQPLRYSFELALTGMKDGPVPYTLIPLLGRLHLLLRYKKEWPALQWTHETRMRMPLTMKVGYSRGFLYTLHSSGVNRVLQLAELPSIRLGRAPSRTRQPTISTVHIDDVDTDSSQNILVVGYVYRRAPNAPNASASYAINIQFRDMWTFGKHPRASTLMMDVDLLESSRPVRSSLRLCGGKVSYSVTFENGKTKHLVTEWRGTAIKTFEYQDLMFLNERKLLSLSRTSGRSTLNLFDITDLHNMIEERRYELPLEWARHSIQFCANTSPANDLPGSSPAVFYPDPSCRMFGLKVNHSSGREVDWVFMKESLFTSPSHKDRSPKLPWSHWSNNCIVRRVDPAVTWGPCINGSRVVYLSHNKRHGHGERLSRLKLIDFCGHSDSAARVGSWSFVGCRAMVWPNESQRDLRPSEEVEEVRLAEDNILVYYAPMNGNTEVDILTFGATVHAPRHDLHSPQL